MSPRISNLYIFLIAFCNFSSISQAARFKGELSPSTFTPYIRAYYEHKTAIDQSIQRDCSRSSDVDQNRCDAQLKATENEGVLSPESVLRTIKFLSEINWEQAFVDSSLLRLLLEIHNRLCPEDNLDYRHHGVHLIRSRFHGKIIHLEKVEKVLKEEKMFDFLNDFLNGNEKVQDGLGWSDLTSRERKAMAPFFFFPTFFKDIGREMEVFCHELISKIKQAKIEGLSFEEIAAWAHNRIVAIHPYTNGNGRLARVFANLILNYGNEDFFWPANAKSYLDAVDADIKTGSNTRIFTLIKERKK